MSTTHTTAFKTLILSLSLLAVFACSPNTKTVAPPEIVSSIDQHLDAVNLDEPVEIEDQEEHKTTAEQDAVADILFHALQQKNLADIKQHADPIFAAEFDHNPQLLNEIMGLVPTKAIPSDKQIETVTLSTVDGYGEILLATYTYTFTNRTVYFDVAFDGSSTGNTLIKGLNVTNMPETTSSAL